MAGNTPCPVSGTLYDCDGSTAVASATVVVRNYTKGEQETATTDVSGQFTIDLGGFTTQWAANDFVYITAYKDHKHAVAVCKLATSQSSWEVDLFFMPGDMPLSTCVLKRAICTTNATARTFCFIERDTNLMKLQVNVAASVTQPINLGKGVLFRGGFYLIRGAANSTVQEMSTGASNNLGDVDSNGDITVTTIYDVGNYSYSER